MHHDLLLLIRRQVLANIRPGGGWRLLNLLHALVILLDDFVLHLMHIHGIARLAVHLLRLGTHILHRGGMGELGEILLGLYRELLLLLRELEVGILLAYGRSDGHGIRSAPPGTKREGWS